MSNYVRISLKSELMESGYLETGELVLVDNKILATIEEVDRDCFATWKAVATDLTGTFLVKPEDRPDEYS